MSHLEKDILLNKKMSKKKLKKEAKEELEEVAEDPEKEGKEAREALKGGKKTVAMKSPRDQNIKKKRSTSDGFMNA